MAEQNRRRRKVGTKQDKTIEIFENAPVSKAVFINIIPSVVSMIMVLVYNLADTFFIGQTKDPLKMAAVSLATPAFLFFYGSGNAFRHRRHVSDFPYAGTGKGR